MATIERNRVFEQAGIEEFRQGGVTILSEAERISAELASLAGQVSSICARVPEEAKEVGLDTLASQARTEIEAADYQTTKGRIEQFAGKINSDIYAADVLASEAQKEAREAAATTITMLGELEELLTDGNISLPYETFKEQLDVCKKEMTEELPNIEEKLRQAEDTMCGMQRSVAIDNFFYRQREKRVERVVKEGILVGNAAQVLMQLVRSEVIKDVRDKISVVINSEIDGEYMKNWEIPWNYSESEYVGELNQDSVQAWVSINVEAAKVLNNFHMIRDKFREGSEYVENKIDEVEQLIDEYYREIKDGTFVDKRIEDIKAFIPQNITNETVLDFFEIASGLSYIPEWKIADNAKDNQVTLSLESSPLTPGDYIENQAEWGNVKYGFSPNSDMAYSGCEIIAVYNAKVALGEEVSVTDMVDLISQYEREGAVLNGEMGTAPEAVIDYFNESGYEVSATSSKDQGIVNEIGEKSDTVIVTAYNNENDITKQIHTVSITKNQSGKYTIHNAFNWDGTSYCDKGSYSTLQEAIENISTDSAAISVIGISKPEE